MLKAAAIHYNNLLRAYEGKAGNLLDSKIYGPAKLLLTSRPYIDGISDPHPVRVFLVVGDESPVRLGIPETIEISTSKTASLTELPGLQGTWGHGEGNSRSGDALIGAGRLMAYMGDKWDNEAERHALWHEMIRNAGGGPEDIRTYGDFVTKRRDIRPATGTRIERAMPNVSNSIPLDDAQRKLNRLVWDFMRNGKGTLGLNVTMGVGKTRAVIKSLGEYLTPDMSQEAVLAVTKDVSTEWMDYVCVWRRLRDCIKFRSMNRIHQTKEHLFLNWMIKPASIPWDKEHNRPAIPILIMDGTMRRELVEQVFPFNAYHEIEVDPCAGARIIQSTFKGSKSECLYGSSDARIADGQDDAKRIADAKALRAAVIEFAGDEPLITYKEFEELEGASAHFGAIEGLDAFRGNNLVVYGRPLPPPYSVEDMACSIFQNAAAIRRIKGKWYPKRNVARRGHQSAFMTEFHPDARVEAVRWLICEAQIMQAIARSRYVREPVTVSILNGTPLPLRIDQVIPRDRMTRDWVRIYDADELDLSSRAFVAAHPAITKDERTAKRIVEERMEAFARQFAFVVEYRKVVPGTKKMAPGKASKKMVKRYPDCVESLFEGTVRARQQNEVAFVVREADWLMREGIEEFDALEAGHLDQHVMGVLQDRLVQGSWPWAIGSAGEITGMTENCEN